MKGKNDIIARFIQLREAHGPTQSKFGKLLGITDVSVSRMESGHTTINEKHLKLISGVLGINEEWLRSGKGEMFKGGKAPGEDAIMEIFRSLSPQGQKMVLDYAKVILNNEKTMRGEDIADEKGDKIPTTIENVA